MTPRHDKLDGIGFSVAVYTLLLLAVGAIILLPVLWMNGPTRYETAAYIPPPQTRLLPPHSERTDIFRPSETDGLGDPALSALAKAYSHTPELPPPAPVRRRAKQPSRAAEPELAPVRRVFTPPVTTF